VNAARNFIFELVRSILMARLMPQPPLARPEHSPMSRNGALVVLLFCCCAAISVAPQATSKPRFKTAVNLVRITVIARDVYGKSIRNLGASDFLVTDDGRAQRLDSLVRVERGRKKAEPKQPDRAKTGDSIEDRPRYSDAGSSGYLIVAFDSMGGQFREDSDAKLTAGFASRYFAVRSARRFLQSSSLRNYQVAILGPRGLAQNFTQDRTHLLRALDQVSESLPNPAAGRLMSAGYDLLQQLKAVPGRKAMVIFTDFHANGQDAGFLFFPGSSDLLPEEAFNAPERFVTAAIDANVALYPVDARGVVPVIPFGDATTTSGEMNSGGSTEVSQAVTSQISAQNSGLASTNGSLESVALQTGGRAIARSNALEQVFKLLVEDSESYYVLSYYNPELVADGRFHRVSVRANCTCTVQARAGYFAH
jgi:VWFA-related protein